MLMPAQLLQALLLLLELLALHVPVMSVDSHGTRLMLTSARMSL
jgi:hypothetical protein